MGRNVSVMALYNHEGKVLLQKRDQQVAFGSGQWGFFGGGIKEKESELDAVRREIQEELNYKVSNPKLIGEQTIFDDSTMYLYEEAFDETQEITLLEGETYGWFTLEEVRELDMIPHDKKILLEVKEEKSSYGPTSTPFQKAT